MATQLQIVTSEGWLHHYKLLFMVCKCEKECLKIVCIQVQVAGIEVHEMMMRSACFSAPFEVSALIYTVCTQADHLINIS